MQCHGATASAHGSLHVTVIPEAKPYVTVAWYGVGIKAIKLYAWEQPYIDRINELREAELKMIRKAAFYQIFNTIMFGGGPILVSLASFGTFSMLGYPLTASVAFPALALFNLLRFPVMMFPNQIMNLIAAKVALDRIQKYMQVGHCDSRWLSLLYCYTIVWHCTDFMPRAEQQRCHTRCVLDALATRWIVSHIVCFRKRS